MNIFGKVSGLIGGKKQDDDDDDDSEAFPDVREHLIPEHLAPDQARRYFHAKEYDFDGKGVVSYLIQEKKRRGTKDGRSMPLSVDFSAEGEELSLDMVTMPRPTTHAPWLMSCGGAVRGAPADVIQWAVDPKRPNSGGSGPHHFPIVRTPNRPNCALTIKLSKHMVKPTMYTFRHGWQNSYYAMRHWVFEAKQVGTDDWFIVSEHHEDGSPEKPFSITDAFSPASFIVKGKFFADELRLRQIGENSGGYEDMYVCGFEIYGKLCKKEKRSLLA